MTYVANPTDGTRPIDSDDASGGAAELRALKAYLQTLISGGTPITGYAYQAFRNKLINGNFDIWDYGITSQPAAVQTQFVANRWFESSSGTTIAPSQQTFALGQTDVPFEPTFYHRAVVASVAGVNNYAKLQQCIERVRTFAGQTLTLSFWAKADAAKNMAIEFVQYFGTGGSPSGTVRSIGAQLIALTTAWKFYAVQIAIPSIAGKTLGTAGNDSLQLNLWWEAGSTLNANTANLGQQSGTFDISGIQAEPGGSATPFELRPLQVEKSLCQRFYWQTNQTSGAAVGSQGVFSSNITNGQNYFASVRFPTTMRAAPSIAVNPAFVSGFATVVSVNADTDATILQGTATGTASGFYFATVKADAELPRIA